MFVSAFGATLHNFQTGRFDDLFPRNGGPRIEIPDDAIGPVDVLHSSPAVQTRTDSRAAGLPCSANRRMAAATKTLDTMTADAGAEVRRQEALLKTGALQNAILNSANFSSIATDDKGVIQLFNVGAERMLGYAAADVLNKITPADISDPQELIARADTLSVELGTTISPGFDALVFKASRGIEDIYELTYIRKDGSRFPAIVSVTALRNDQGGIIGYLLIGTDNTARKRVEAEQQKLDQRLRDQHFYTRSLIESNIDALMTTDAAGIITDVNRQMEALTGCTRDELIGAPFKNYFTDPERAAAGIKRVLREKKITNYELTARARDGKMTVVSYNATTFYDRDRTLAGRVRRCPRYHRAQAHRANPSGEKPRTRIREIRRRADSRTARGSGTAQERVSVDRQPRTAHAADLDSRIPRPARVRRRGSRCRTTWSRSLRSPSAMPSV